MDWLDFTKEIYCYDFIRKERESRPPSEVEKKLKELQNICELWRCGKMKAGQLVEDLGLERYNFKLLGDKSIHFYYFLNKYNISLINSILLFKYFNILFLFKDNM